MGPFLRGFAEELIKVAVPRPAESFGPTAKPLASIRPQVMRSPPKAKREFYRPSPRYRPKPAAAAPAVTKPTGGGRGRKPRKPREVGVPWESGPGTLGRMLREGAHRSKFRGKAALKKEPDAQKRARRMAAVQKKIGLATKGWGTKPRATPPTSLGTPHPRPGVGGRFY